MTTKPSAAAISRILAAAAFKRANDSSSAWSSGFTVSQNPDSVSIYVAYVEASKVSYADVEQMVEVLNHHPSGRYFAKIENEHWISVWLRDENDPRQKEARLQELLKAQTSSAVVVPRTVRLGDSADSELVVLSENEEILLSRMRDEDDTEYHLYFGPGSVPEPFFKAAPRDQVETLLLRGLVDICYTGRDRQEAVRGGSADKNAVHLTDKGHAVLDKIQSVTVDSLGHLSEDELLDLAVQKIDEIDTIETEGNEVAEIFRIVETLKGRRDARKSD